MFTAKEEALLLVYIAAFSKFTKAMQARLAKLLEKKGENYTGFLYRGQPHENASIQSKYPFFSTTKFFHVAQKFTTDNKYKGERLRAKPGTVFQMNAEDVKALDLTQIIFSDKEEVKQECKRLIQESSFEDWWKEKGWLEYQKKEGEVLVLNKLNFKRPKNFYCDTQKRKRWCKERRFVTLSTDMTRKERIHGNPM